MLLKNIYGIDLTIKTPPGNGVGIKKILSYEINLFLNLQKKLKKLFVNC